jgi:hypothetical protein
MYIRTCLFCLLICISLSSCVRNYGIANQTYDTKKLSLPFYEEEANSAIYIGASYENFLGVTEDVYNVSAPDDNYYLYSFDAHYAKVYKNVNFAAGLSTYGGTYELGNFPVEEVNGPKDLWGVGGTLEGGVNTQAGNFNIRPFGLKITGILEKGEYADFRRTWLDTAFNGLNYVNGNENDFSLNVSITGGITYKVNNVEISTDIVLGMANARTPFGFNLRLRNGGIGLLLNYTQDLSLGRGSFGVGVNYAFPLNGN